MEDKIVELLIGLLNKQEASIYILIVIIVIYIGGYGIQQALYVRREKRLAARKAKDDRRIDRYIDICNCIYNKMADMNMCRNKKDFKNMLSEYLSYIKHNKLFLSSKECEMLMSFHDYCLNVQIDFSNRKIEEEDKILDKFKHEFEK